MTQLNKNTKQKELKSKYKKVDSLNLHKTNYSKIITWKKLIL